MVLVTTVIIDSFGIYQNKKVVIELKSAQAESIARLAASHLDGTQLKELADVNYENSYFEIAKQNLGMDKEAAGVKYLYAVQPILDTQQIRYIVEGQASYDNPDDIYEYNTLVDYSYFFDSKKESDAFVEAFQTGQVYVNGLYQDPEFGYLLTVFAPIIDGDGNCVGMVGVDLDADRIMKEANRLVIMIVVITLLGLIIVFLLSKILIRNKITKPLEQIVAASDALITGDVNAKIDVASDDEIGQLAESFRMMIENIRLQANAAERIAHGDLEATLTPKSEKDVLSISLNNVIAELSNLTIETGKLTKAAVEGDLNIRGDVEGFRGGYRTIVSGINDTLDALIGPLKMSADYMKQISNGEIPEKITDEYRGDFDEIKESINVCIDAINSLVADMQGLSAAAIEGKLDKRADCCAHTGDFKKVVDGVNATLDAVIHPLQMAASYINQIGKGEIPEKITDEYRGDFDEIKKSINACIDGLGGLAEGRDVLEKMAQNDYTVTVQGQYLGIYAQMAESINTVGVQINQAIQVLSDVAEGNLDDLAQLKESGQLSEQDKLVPSLIMMIENISNLVEETRTLSLNAVQGELSVRGNASKFKGEYHHVIKGVNETLDAVIAPIQEASAVLKEMARGNLDVTMNGDYQGDHAEIKTSLNETISNLRIYITEISSVLAEMANSNLDIALSADYKGDFIEIKNSLNHISVSLSQVLGDISDAAEQVNAGARQVSDGSQTLSQGSTEQASAIQQLTASIEDIASQTKHNAVNASQASDLAENARNNAIKGNDQMKEMLHSMVEINDSSANISKIIKVIDDIAFQTNILALNAAVEAARAGQHGKGFAVVAEEVRNLAARSAAAARETTDLIEGSIGKVQTGTKIANETASALLEIVEGIEQSAKLIVNIAEASNEQASGITQINKGIEQVSQVVQNNSATAEESAAASEELSSQAEMLREMVGHFRLALGESTTQQKQIGDGSGNSQADKRESNKMQEPQIMLDDPGFDKY